MPSVGAGSHQLIFSHPQIGDLSVWTGADQIRWGYNLNTATFPTYAGEVIQILSVYIDDLIISGTTRDYHDIETYYGYFLNYLQTATQGRNPNPIAGQSSYNQEPMTFSYPHRGWKFEIIPMSVPGFRISREIVATNWQIRAFVVDDTGDVSTVAEMIKQTAEQKAMFDSEGGFELRGEIGFVEDNPFSDPFTPAGANFNPSQEVSQLADYYNKLIPSYLQGDFDSLTGGLGSKPAFGSTTPPSDTIEHSSIKTNKQLLAKSKKKKNG